MSRVIFERSTSGVSSFAVIEDDPQDNELCIVVSEGSSVAMKTLSADQVFELMVSLKKWCSRR